MSVKHGGRAVTQYQDNEVGELLDWLDQRNRQVWEKPLESDLDFGRLAKLLGEEEPENDADAVRPVFEWKGDASY